MIDLTSGVAPTYTYDIRVVDADNAALPVTVQHAVLNGVVRD